MKRSLMGWVVLALVAAGSSAQTTQTAPATATATALAAATATAPVTATALAAGQGEAIGIGPDKDSATADGIRRAVAQAADPILVKQLGPWVAEEKVAPPQEPVRPAMAMLIRQTLNADAAKFATAHEVVHERYEANEWVVRHRARGEQVPDLPGSWEVAVRATLDEPALVKAKNDLVGVLAKAGRPVVRLWISETLEGERQKSSQVQTRLADQISRAGFDVQPLVGAASQPADRPVLASEAAAQALAASLAATFDRPCFVLVGTSEAAITAGGKTDTVVYLFQAAPKAKPVLMATLSPDVKVLRGDEGAKLDELAMKSHARQLDRPVMQRLLASWPDLQKQVMVTSLPAGE
jgi:hypothetical protein